MRRLHRSLYLGALYLLLNGMPAASLAQAPLDGASLYIEALKAQGANPNVIWSGYVEAECLTTLPPPTEQQIQAAISEKSESVRQSIAAAKDAVMRRQLELALQNIPSAVRDWMKAKAESRTRTKTLFRGPVPGGPVRLEIERYDSAQQEWGPATILLRRFPEGPKQLQNLLWEPSANLATISSTIGAALSVEEFGRILGEQHRRATMALLDPQNPVGFKFSEEAIQKFREELAKQAAAGTIRPFEIVKTVAYDSSEAQIVETHVRDGKEWVLKQRFSVDPSRGFICPLVQWFYRNGQVAQEWNSSRYKLLPESGLWYPLSHTMSQYREDGGLTERREYQIVGDTLRFNFDISDDEFAVALPQDAVAMDARKPEHPSCRLSKSLNVTFSDLADLSKWPGAEPVVVASPAGPPLGTGRRWMIVLLNALGLIVIVLVVWWRQSHRGARAVMVLLAWMNFGCSPASGVAAAGGEKGPPILSARDITSAAARTAAAEYAAFAATGRLHSMGGP